MRFKLVAAVPLMIATAAFAQRDGRPDPRDPRAKAAPVEYRSAFEGYRPFVDTELRDWRKSNEEVGAAGGHAGQRSGQGAGAQSSKPQPGKPETSGQGGHK